MKTLQPHQQRVVTELDELKTRTLALGVFLQSTTFQGLDSREQFRLERQWELMQQLGQILSERIEAFA